MSRIRQPIPVSVLTGFLGSGKTTLLNRWVSDNALARSLVLINEFGEVGIDHDLVAESADAPVVELSSGCLCCTIRGDLLAALRGALVRFSKKGDISFDRVLLETTGLADPAPILHTLMTHPQLTRFYRLDGVLTTVDTAGARPTRDQPATNPRNSIAATRRLGYNHEMQLQAHDHRHSCDCPAHRAPVAAGRNGGRWAAVFPLVACAVCPACMATYAKVLSLLGVGFELSELQHVVLLVVALSASVGVSAWRSFRTGRFWPIGVALGGSALIAMGHLSGDVHALEWAGVLLLLAGGLTEHFRLLQGRVQSAPV